MKLNPPVTLMKCPHPPPSRLLERRCAWEEAETLFVAALDIAAEGVGGKSGNSCHLILFPEREEVPQSHVHIPMFSFFPFYFFSFQQELLLLASAAGGRCSPTWSRRWNRDSEWQKSCLPRWRRVHHVTVASMCSPMFQTSLMWPRRHCRYCRYLSQSILCTTTTTILLFCCSRLP